MYVINDVIKQRELSRNNRAALALQQASAS
jgi:hypothetical protein